MRRLLSARPLGPELPLETFVESPFVDVASNASGMTVAASTDRQTYVRRIGPDGVPLGEASLVADGDEFQKPGVAVAADGSFVVVYETFAEPAPNTSQSYAVHAQAYRADGSPYPVSPVLEDSATSSAEVVARPGGGYLVAWEKVVGSVRKLFVLPLSIDGTPGAATSPAAFDVAHTDGTSAPRPRLAVDAGGRIAVAIAGSRQDSTGAAPTLVGVLGADLTVSVAPFKVSDFTGGRDVGMASDGRLVVLYAPFQDGTAGTPLIRRFSASGSPAGDPQAIDAVDEDSSIGGASLAVAADGSFLVGFLHVDSSGPVSVTSLRVREFHADGTPDGAAVKANSKAAGATLGGIELAVDARGTVSAVWADRWPRYGKDRTLPTFRRFTTSFAGVDRGTLRVFGTGGADTLLASQGDDTLTLVLNGQSFTAPLASVTDVRVELGHGNDTADLSGLTVRATLFGQKGDDTLTGSSGGGLVGGGGNDDLISGGPGDDTLRGAYGLDTITGGGGTDVLDEGPQDPRPADA